MPGSDPTIATLRERAPVTPSALLRPARYFLAGSGVLTLTFEGFTAGILALKQAISAHLGPENPGSMWPKVTLAALNGPGPLASEELERLWQATSRADSMLAANPVFVRISEVVVVEALTRSLEMRGESTHFLLSKDAESHVPSGHAAWVRRVLGQWSEHPSQGYVRTVQRAGHTREHYQRPCRLHTLVSPVPEVLPGMAELREHVNRILPGRFHWFPSEARHLTVRTLEARPDSEFEAVQFLAEDDLDD